MCPLLPTYLVHARYKYPPSNLHLNVIEKSGESSDNSKRKNVKRGSRNERTSERFTLSCSCFNGHCNLSLSLFSFKRSSTLCRDKSSRISLSLFLSHWILGYGLFLSGSICTSLRHQSMSFFSTQSETKKSFLRKKMYVPTHVNIRTYLFMICKYGFYILKLCTQRHNTLR